MNLDEESIKGALSVPCPKCGALPGVRCRTELLEKLISYPHIDRIRLGQPRQVVEQ